MSVSKNGYVTIAEAAVMLGVSINSVRNYIRRGYLHPFRKPGMNALLLQRKEVEEFGAIRPAAKQDDGTT